ncbi:MAG: flagellar filament outer layer protein FlaA [Treponema sp.]|nr:flagellar filament outer layer protein FlaA [Treponema sp.]
MKKFLIVTFIFLIGSFLHAQEWEVGTTDPTRIGIDTAQQMIMEVSVDRFEHDGLWRSRMSSDDGFTTTRLFRGAPAGRQPIPGEEGMDIPDNYVLGTRVDFLRRGYHSFFIYPVRPIPIEGIVKTISMWVVGRNFNHELFVLVRDFFGRQYEFSMGRLNFMGWQRMFAVIPPAPDDGLSGVVQRSRHHFDHFGLQIVGFRIDVDPMEARGSYYIYFDALRAYTDLFSEHHRDPDDMVDGW